jgi:hypothetical protein
MPTEECAKIELNDQCGAQCPDLSKVVQISKWLGRSFPNG